VSEINNYKNIKVKTKFCVDFDYEKWK